MVTWNSGSGQPVGSVFVISEPDGSLTGLPVDESGQLIQAAVEPDALPFRDGSELVAVSVAIDLMTAAMRSALERGGFFAGTIDAVVASAVKGFQVLHEAPYDEPEPDLSQLSPEELAALDAEHEAAQEHEPH